MTVAVNWQHLLRKTAQQSLMLLALLWSAEGLAATPLPAIDCQHSDLGAIETMICQDAELGQLERQMTALYQQLLPQAALQQPFLFNAEQRGWQKGRNDCWKDTAPKACVLAQYQRRTAELQAMYRLVDTLGPVTWRCAQQAATATGPGRADGEVLVTFFKTTPESLLAERGDQQSLMFLQPDDKKRLFVGRNESLEFKAQHALLIWGYQSPVLVCESVGTAGIPKLRATV
ncbi:hypothetical protein A5320_02775 [Rheinheimera sp. SA_1]|uniref:lysozyme inhibitor LprI family protein n=1 Tax=Rheinheimera sp. SA_1 TaxID=1827365 RepID=UPI0008001FBB|nr:lysozyme inhibitor LprI family protein [Rheinheimera sp. SA_1]OBP16351.1 hypothetical protein A5320_02775 [Rheinheimera sp. SA_1]